MSHDFSRRTLVLCCFAALSFLCQSTVLSAAVSPQSTQEPIINQALVFVRLLDQQKPLDAWAITTLYFRKNISPQSWQRHYRARRARLGRPTSRRVESYRYHSSFERAQDGLYLQIRFRTDFEARADVIERVEMYKDFDGRWRLIGYFLEFE